MHFVKKYSTDERVESIKFSIRHFLFRDPLTETKIRVQYLHIYLYQKVIRKKKRNVEGLKKMTIKSGLWSWCFRLKENDIS